MSYHALKHEQLQLGKIRKQETNLHDPRLDTALGCNTALAFCYHSKQKPLVALNLITTPVL